MMGRLPKDRHLGDLCRPTRRSLKTTVYDYDTLLTRLREQAFLNAGVRITLSATCGAENR